MKKLRRHSRQKKLVLFAFVSLLIFIAFLIFQSVNSRNEINVASNEGEGYINYDEPSDEERLAGDNEKFSNNESGDRLQNNDTGLQEVENVSVIITDAGQYGDKIEVRSFIPDYYQDGTCTITFTQDALKITKETPAYKDITTTVCTNPLFNRSDFPVGGEWQVVVSYKAPNAQGVSSPQSVLLN